MAFKIKTVRIKTGYDRTLHKININALRDGIKYIEKVTESYKPNEHLEQTLKEKIRIANEKLTSLIPHRFKRGLVNALGKVVKFIAGNPDSEDLEIIHQSLGVLQTEENKIVRNQIQQIHINDLFKDQINTITNSIKKLNAKISKEFNTVQNIRSDLEFVNLIWNIDKILRILESIEEQIEFSRLGLINKNILSLEEKQYIVNKLTKQNIRLSYIDEILQFTTATIGINEGQAVILVKTPILDGNTYDLLELHTLNFNETRINTHINLVAKHGTLIYSQSSKCDICESENLVEDDCIYKILTHQPPACQFTRTKQTVQIKEVMTGIILVDTATTMEVKDSCGDSRIISDATIIETESCTIKIRNYTFSGKPKMTFQEEYLIPIYSKPLQNLNYSNDDEEESILRIQNLETLEEIQISLDRTQTWVTIGGVITLILIVVCLFTAFSYRTTKNKISTEDNDKTPQVITLKNINTEEQPADTSKPFIPIPRFKL